MMRALLTWITVILLSGCATPPEDRPLSEIMRADTFKAPSDLPAQLEQGTLVLSLDHCLELALGGNIDLQLASLTPQIRGEDFYISGATFDPKFYARYTKESREEQTSNSQVGADVLEEENEVIRLGVRKTWGLGTRTDLRWAMDRNEDNSEFRTLNPSYDSDLVLEIVQPLLGGFGVNVNRAELNRTLNNREIAEAEFELLLESELLSVYRSYWNLALAAAEFELEQQSMALAEEQLAITQDRLDVGRAAPLDLTRAEASTARQQESLTAAETRYEAASDILLQQILPEQWPAYLDLRVIPSSELDPSTNSLDLPTLQAAFSNAITDRAELQIANLQMSNAELDQLVAKNRRLPRLDLIGEYGFTGQGSNRTDSRQSMADMDFPVWKIGLELEFFFMGESRAARFRQTVLQLESESVKRQRAVALILYDVRSALQQLRSAEKQYQAATRTVTLLREQYEGELDRYEIGRSTLFSTESDRRDLLDAERSRLQARVGIEVSQAVLLAAQGRFADDIIRSIVPDGHAENSSDPAR
jgi:outer membrane protein TolC